jgi:hypothetical protein
MATTTYNFTTPSDFTLNNIVINSLIASIELDTLPSVFTQSFSSSSGFTFNGSNTAVGSGNIAQISQLITPSLTNEVNVSVAGGNVTKNAGGAAWNAGVTSVQSLSGSGLVEIQVASVSSVAYMFGLAQINPGGIYTGIDYAIYVINNNIQIYELGTFKGNAGGISVNDILQVVVTGTTVTYVKNGTVVYTSLTSATFPLYFACSILNTGNTVSDIQIQSGVNQYVGDVITLPEFSYPGPAGSITGFSGFSVTDSGSPRYVLNSQYYNGTAWVSSNNSYSQANSKTVVASNIPTLPASNSLVIDVVTQSGSVQEVISNPLLVDYSGQIYTSGNIETNSSFSASQLLSFSTVGSAGGSDSLLFGVVVNGMLSYYNGSSWVVSNGSVAQLNTAAEVNANVSSLLPVDTGNLLQFYVLLSSGNGSTTPDLTSFSATYTYRPITPTLPVTCNIFGYLYDLTGEPVENASITFALLPAFTGTYIEEGSTNLIGQTVAVVNTDPTGYFETQLIQSASFDAPLPTIALTLNYTNSAGQYITTNKNSQGSPLIIQVPSTFDVNITELLT